MKKTLKRRFSEKTTYFYISMSFFITSLIGESKIVITLWFASAVCIILFIMSFLVPQVSFYNSTFVLNEKNFFYKQLIKKSDIKKIIKSEDYKKIEIHLVNGKIIFFKPFWSSKKSINSALMYFESIMHNPDL